MGWIRSSQLSDPPPWRLRQIHSPMTKPECKLKFYTKRNELWRKAGAIGVPQHLLIGISTTDLKILVQSLSHKLNSAKTGQSAENKATFNTAPSAPQQELIDLTDPQAKNAYPRGGL